MLNLLKMGKTHVESNHMQVLIPNFCAFGSTWLKYYDIFTINII